MSKLAVIRTGGKQYLVKAGDSLRVEKLAANGKVSLDDVLLVADENGSQVEVGTPKVKSAVSASVTKQGRARKITVVHYKAKVRYHKKYGHRQPFTELKVSAVA